MLMKYLVVLREEVIMELIKMKNVHKVYKNGVTAVADLTLNIDK